MPSTKTQRLAEFWPVKTVYAAIPFAEHCSGSKPPFFPRKWPIISGISRSILRAERLAS